MMNILCNLKQCISLLSTINNSETSFDENVPQNFDLVPLATEQVAENSFHTEVETLTQPVVLTRLDTF